MKLLTERRRRWFARRRHYEAKRKSRKLHPKLIQVLVAGSSFVAPAGRAEPMPEVLCFDEDCQGTVEALAQVRNRLFTPIRGGTQLRLRRIGNRRQISTGSYKALECIKRITPAAALVLAAEYDRVGEIAKKPQALVNIPAWDTSVRTMLQGIGFLALFGIVDGDATSTDVGGTAVLRMRTGRTHDPVAINDLVESLKLLFPASDHPDQAKTMGLFGALTEAVGNVVHHAYPANGTYIAPHVGRWWMTGAVDRDAGWTAAAVYDQGTTIPVSLPDWANYPGVKRRVIEVAQRLQLTHEAGSPRWDGHAIEAAVEESSTSTGLSGRGHGLAQMREFVDACQDGRLRILSRYGEVVFRPNQRPYVNHHRAPISGTLVEWSVLLR